MKYLVLKLPLFWTADSVKQFYQDQFLWKVLPKSSGYIFYSTQSGFLALKSEYAFHIHTCMDYLDTHSLLHLLYCNLCKPQGSAFSFWG